MRVFMYVIMYVLIYKIMKNIQKSVLAWHACIIDKINMSSKNFWP